MYKGLQDTWYRSMEIDHQSNGHQSTTQLFQASPPENMGDSYSYPDNTGGNYGYLFLITAKPNNY
jgi:hypothetical protein